MKEVPLNSRMNRFLLLSLAAGLLSPIPAEAFWGLTKEESRICRQRASREKNEFSAKQTYEYCKKTIKRSIKENEKELKKHKELFSSCISIFFDNFLSSDSQKSV